MRKDISYKSLPSSNPKERNDFVISKGSIVAFTNSIDYSSDKIIELVDIRLHLPNEGSYVEHIPSNDKRSIGLFIHGFRSKKEIVKMVYFQLVKDQIHDPYMKIIIGPKLLEELERKVY